jgi:hypothetical protein
LPGSFYGFDSGVVVTCASLSTGDSVTIPVIGATHWNCIMAGLGVTPDNLVRMTISGPAN